MDHKHDIKKTHVSFIEFDDVQFQKLVDLRYFGEGNSKGRVLEFDFEYCLGCGLRLLDGKPIMTRGILEDEFDRVIGSLEDMEAVESALCHTVGLKQ